MSITREDILKAVLEAGECGVGYTDPHGEWLRITCNDKSLEGDKYYYRADCSCSKVADAVMALIDQELRKC